MESPFQSFFGSAPAIKIEIGALKSRGFNLEDTRLKDPERLSRLLALLALAFARAFVVVLW